MKVEITVRQETVNGVIEPKKYQVYVRTDSDALFLHINKESLEELVTQLTSEAEKALKV